LARELREHRARQAALGFDRVKPGALIFQTASGKPVARRNVTRAIGSASRRAGLVKGGQELVGAHDLRHSLAGCAFALGLSPVEVSKMLRHANPQVTLTVYAGMAEGAALAAGDKLAAVLGSYPRHPRSPEPSVCGRPQTTGDSVPGRLRNELALN
jgi:integrase